MSRHRCEAATVRGHQCRQKAIAYHQHTDGREYLVCKAHHTHLFKPVPHVPDRSQQR